MPTKCPHCAAVHTEPLSTHGLSFRRCPTCNRFYTPSSNANSNSNSSATTSSTSRRSPELSAHSLALDTPPVSVLAAAVDQTPIPRIIAPANPTLANTVTTLPPRRPNTVGPVVPGYHLERVLGRGGMGTVYLARQLSLDRPVALKVMSRSWANDPTFVARFTREAFAAAQLNHPNLVQVYDIGELDGTKYFSMEYVAGRSMADVISHDGKLDPETAVGYILQAARALAHAHERGMIHRDIKPDNLLIDANGLVKVADLGLVKTPDLTRDADKLDSDLSSASGLHTLPPDMTGTRMALGTPAYMSPEQCRDAATVDHRADIYSLGCTLYAMVTGQQPFEGHSAVQLMTAHAYKPLVPPEEVASRVPKALSHIIQRMMAKNPDDRYPTMGEVVRALETWLGVPQVTMAGKAREEHIAALEDLVMRFNTTPTTQLRSRVLTGFLSSCLIASVVLLFLGRVGWAFGIAGMVLQAAMVYFVVHGLERKAYVFQRVRQFLCGFSIGDWLVFGGLVIMFGVLLWMLKLFAIWLGFGLIGLGLALAARVVLDRPQELEREGVLAGCERLLKKLRANGRDETQIRLFVAKYSGRYWEELFESLFGFEEKLAMRTVLLRGESAGRRERFAEWREPIVAVIDRIEHRRQAARERELLANTERDRLIAAGHSPRTAARIAERQASIMVRTADAVRQAEIKNSSSLGLSASSTTKQWHQLRRTPCPSIGPKASWFEWVVFAFVGPHVRGVLATLLLAACAMWAVQNQILATDFGEAPLVPLVIPGVSPELTQWCDSANLGLAGIVLLTSLFYRGYRMSVMVLIGAAITIGAHKLTTIPSVEPIHDYHVGAMVGLMLSLVGYRFGRR